MDLRLVLAAIKNARTCMAAGFWHSHLALASKECMALAMALTGCCHVPCMAVRTHGS